MSRNNKFNRVLFIGSYTSYPITGINKPGIK